MMILIVKYTVMTSVILLMLAVGLRTEFGQVVAVAKNARLMSRGLIVNFIVTPVLLFVSVRWLPIPIDVKIGVMLMAAAPVARDIVQELERLRRIATVGPDDLHHRWFELHWQ